MSETEKKLEVRNVSFRYGKKGRQVLSGINLEVTGGEVVGIEAPSGYGKTTLCKIIAGYEKPDTGEVLYNGKTVLAKGYCPVQMIWQHPEQSVNPRLRMEEVIKEGDRIEARVLSGLGIEEDWMKRFPSELSGGELQRFCIARALGERTEFLLADEISAMLDLITQSQIWNFLLEETRRREIGMIAVSHSPGLLSKVCTRVVALN